MGLELAKAFITVGASAKELTSDFSKIQGEVHSKVSGLARMVGPAVAAVVGGAGIA